MYKALVTRQAVHHKVPQVGGGDTVDIQLVAKYTRLASQNPIGKSSYLSIKARSAMTASAGGFGVSLQTC